MPHLGGNLWAYPMTLRTCPHCGDRHSRLKKGNRKLRRFCPACGKQVVFLYGKNANKGDRSQLRKQRLK